MPIKLIESESVQGTAGSVPELGWHRRNQWDDSSIKNLADPMGAAAYRNISSYPTPTGRIEFFRDAFVFVLNDLNDKTTKWNQAVSDCLDVWEMLFYADYFEDRLTFDKWGKEHLDDLFKSPIEEHKDLAKVLKMYFTNEISEVYILMHKDGGQKIPFAGTSPYTGFFLTPNTLSFKVGVPEKVGIYYFDHMRIRTFEERPDDFKRYMKRMLAAAGTSVLSELRNYIDKFPLSGFESDIIILKQQYDNYADILDNNKEKLILPGNIPVKKSHIPTTDDFLEHYVVRLPYYINDEHFYTYADANQKVKYLLPIKKEVLKYANIEVENPDAMRDLLANHLKIKAIEGATINYLEVTLNLDIQGVGVPREFRRRYVEQVSPDLRELKNRGEGHIIDYKMGLMLFPLIKCSNDNTLNNFYSVGIIDFETSQHRNSDKLSLSFVKGRDQYVPSGNITQSNRREKKIESAGGSTYYTLEGEGVDFDFIELTISQASGISAKNLIIPKWTKRAKGDNEISFAVDFGTSNTYVAYTKSADPRSLNFDGVALAARLDNEMGQTFADETRDIQKLEFVPSFVRENDYQFPIRTAIAETLLIQAQHIRMKLLGTSNIPFAFSEANDSHSAIITNLKWKPSPKDQERTKIFISELLVLLKCRMLLSGASPMKTKIYWLYPLSMSNSIKSNLTEIWENQTKAFMGEGVKIIQLTESEAPIHAYRFAFTGHNVVNIDIGGGTSDFLFRQNGKIQKAISCTFAGNALFGDRPMLPLQNGYVLKFAQLLRNELSNQASIEQDRVKSQVMNEQVKILDRMLKPDNKDFASDDVVPFLLVLGLDKKITKVEMNYRLPILFFFAALVYYVAQVYRDMLDGATPTDIAFSGNGGKVLRLLDSTVSLNYRGKLAGLATFICQRVLNKTDIRLITLHLADEPKAATAKGALMSNRAASELIIADPKQGEIPNKEMTQPCIGENLKNSVGESVVPQTFGELSSLQLDYKGNTSEYAKFINLFFESFEECNFSGNYGITGLNLLEIKKKLLDSAEQYYGQAINVQQAKGRESDDAIQEPVFFYAVSGALYDLTRSL